MTSCPAINQTKLSLLPDTALRSLITQLAPSDLSSLLRIPCIASILSPYFIVLAHEDDPDPFFARFEGLNKCYFTKEGGVGMVGVTEDTTYLIDLTERPTTDELRLYGVQLRSHRCVLSFRVTSDVHSNAEAMTFVASNIKNSCLILRGTLRLSDLPRDVLDLKHVYLDPEIDVIADVGPQKMDEGHKNLINSRCRNLILQGEFDKETLEELSCSLATGSISILLDPPYEDRTEFHFPSISNKNIKRAKSLNAQGITALKSIKARNLLSLQISLGHSPKEKKTSNKTYLEYITTNNLQLLSISSAYKENELLLDGLIMNNLRILILSSEFKSIKPLKYNTSLKFPNLSTLSISHPSQMRIFRIFRSGSFANLVLLRLCVSTPGQLGPLVAFNFPNLSRLYFEHNYNSHSTRKILPSYPMLSFAPLLKSVELVLQNTLSLHGFSEKYPFCESLIVKASQKDPELYIEACHLGSLYPNLSRFELIGFCYSTEECQLFSSLNVPKLHSLRISITAKRQIQPKKVQEMNQFHRQIKFEFSAPLLKAFVIEIRLLTLLRQGTFKPIAQQPQPQQQQQHMSNYLVIISLYGYEELLTLRCLSPYAKVKLKHCNKIEILQGWQSPGPSVCMGPLTEVERITMFEADRLQKLRYFDAGYAHTRSKKALWNCLKITTKDIDRSAILRYPKFYQDTVIEFYKFVQEHEEKLKRITKEGEHELIFGSLEGYESKVGNVYDGVQFVSLVDVIGRQVEKFYKEKISR